MVVLFVVVVAVVVVVVVVGGGGGVVVDVVVCFKILCAGVREEEWCAYQGGEGGLAGITHI